MKRKFDLVHKRVRSPAIAPTLLMEGDQTLQARSAFIESLDHGERHPVLFFEVPDFTADRIAHAGTEPVEKGLPGRRQHQIGADLSLLLSHTPPLLGKAAKPGGVGRELGQMSEGDQIEIAPTRQPDLNDRLRNGLLTSLLREEIEVIRSDRFISEQ